MFSLFHELIEQLFETASVLSSLNLIIPFGIKARFLEDERFPILSFSIEQETRLEGFHLSNIIPFVSMQFFNFNRFDFTNIYSLFQLFPLSLFGKFRSFVIHFSRRKKWGSWRDTVGDGSVIISGIVDSSNRPWSGQVGGSRGSVDRSLERDV